MRTIYKYPIPIIDDFTLDLPGGARILDVQIQDGKPCIWAIVDTELPPIRRWFRLAGTGHPLDKVHLIHVGTFQLKGGALVFHLFEVEPNPISGMYVEFPDNLM